MTPHNYRLIRDQLRKSVAMAEDEIKHCLSRVEVPPEDQLRPMTVADVTAGRLVYYRTRESEERPTWKVVEVVLRTPDEAGRSPFVGTDGGWHIAVPSLVEGAPFVEKEAVV